MEEEKSLIEQLNEQVETKLEEVLKEGIRRDNIEYIYKLTDIHKDIANENYWNVKEDNYMMYRGYDNYGRDNYGTYNYNGRGRDSRGRYMDSGRRGYDSKYRGDDMIDEMSMYYGNYMGNRERGNYGGPETSKAFDYMLQSAEDFFRYLKEEANSPEEIEKIQMTASRISEM